jgi:hypothetical protein
LETANEGKVIESEKDFGKQIKLYLKGTANY